MQRTRGMLAERAHIWNLCGEREYFAIFYAKWSPDSLLLFIKAITVILFPFCSGRKEVISAVTWSIDYFFICLKRIINAWGFFAPLHVSLWGTVKKNTLKKTLETAVLFPEKSITIIHLLFAEEAAWSKAELLQHLLHYYLWTASGKGAHVVQNICFSFLFHYTCAKLERTQTLGRREDASELILKYTRT